MILIDRVPQRIGLNERLGILPVVVIRATQQDADIQVNVHQVIRDEFSVHHHTGGNIHPLSPMGHVLVGVIANIWIIERTPTCEKYAPLSHFFITWQSLVEKVEKIIMQRYDFLHELYVLHQAHEIIRKELNRRYGSHAAGIKGGWMNVPAFHQAEHFAGHAAYLQSFAVELAHERIQRAHDVRNGSIAVKVRVRRSGLLSFGEHAWIRFLYHLLAKVHPDQVVLKDVVVEHVLSGFAKIYDPLGDCRRTDSESHVLGIRGTCGVVISANPANAAGDEMGVARVLSLHENAVAAEDR